MYMLFTGSAHILPTTKQRKINSRVEGEGVLAVLVALLGVSKVVSQHGVNEGVEVSTFLFAVQLCVYLSHGRQEGHYQNNVE